jgi:hypothetical protein
MSKLILKHRQHVIIENPTMKTEDKPPLSFLVLKDIWLATTEPSEEHIYSIIGWTETKPQHDNGHVGKGSILIFDHIFEDVLVFTFTDDDIVQNGTPEFFQEELINLTKSGTLALLEADTRFPEISKVIPLETTTPKTVRIESLSIEDKDKFTLLVTKDIWQATTGPLGQHNNRITEWTDVEPQHWFGPRITKGSVLRLVLISTPDDLLYFSLIKNKKELLVKRSFKKDNLTDLIGRGVITLLEADKQSGTYVPTQDDNNYYPVSKEEFSTYSNSIAMEYIDQSILPSCDYIIDKRDTIEFPFAVDYKNEWSIWEGIREIIQNSMDTETRIDIYTPNNNTIVIHDEGKGLSIKDFRLGGGEKAKLEGSKKYDPECNPEKLIRGAHGEGMKLTFLVLSKNPEIYKFYHYSRCIRATAEFVQSQRFKELTLDVYLDPIQPHKGTTFILNAPSKTINELMKYCKTRFIYHNLYINGEKSSHVSYDMLSMYRSQSKYGSNKDKTYKVIGQIVDIYSYDPTKPEDIDKPLYVRGIYVKDLRTVFSYNFICPYLDSARNIVDISQIKGQIERIYTNLEFKGISPSVIAERFVRAIYEGKDIDFIENNVYFGSYDVKIGAQKVYRNVWDIVFGKNAFIETDSTLTQLAMEQIYVERDETDNIINEVHYKPIKLTTLLERVFFSAGVPKDYDIVVQQTIDIPYPIEDLEGDKHRNYLMKNLRDAISVLCPIYDLDPEEEIKKWDVFLVEYKSENQPPKNLWKNWDNISIAVKEEIFDEIRMLYFEFYNYPIIIEKGLKLPIIGLDYYNSIVEKVLSLDKKTILQKYPDIAKNIEKFENRIIPVKQKLGYYNHHTKRFGIRYDCLMERNKTFTVAIHEYAHMEKEVDDIDDYDSAMGKILNVVQTGYGTILNDSLIYADQVYEHYILKTIFDSIKMSDMPKDTRDNMLNSLRVLPDSISEVIFAACVDKKTGKYEPGDIKKHIENIKYIYPDQIEQPSEEVAIPVAIPTEEVKNKQQQEDWERTAYLPSGDYIESNGFTRSEENLDYMLKNYGWDAINKTLIENIEFDAHKEGLSVNIHIIRIEHLTEPLVTNISKKLFPNTKINRYYNVAHTNSDFIVAFNLRDDGKYPNIPWSLRLFINIVPRFT